MVPIVLRARQYPKRTAVIDSNGSISYADLLSDATQIACTLLEDHTDLNEACVAFMVPPGSEYVAVQWGIWLAGGIAVPLCLSHPLPEIQYVLEDTGAERIILHPNFVELMRPLQEHGNYRFLLTTEVGNKDHSQFPTINDDRRGMILYTSGTTSKPKGVVLTHGNITSQITTLIDAWEWSQEDYILHVLPLHHTHGIINVLSCALWSGAICELMQKFDAAMVWQNFIEKPITLFMAVPTIYVLLIDYWNSAPPAQQHIMSQACRKMRLMVSGSAALPVSVLEKWKQISNHTLLERYGMTEIGMALSNPYIGERRPGHVGQPLPGVTLKLVNESGDEINNSEEPGEVRIRGANVFLEYWQKPKATRDAFQNGWFLTGDMAIKNGDYYRLIGRNSVDIIKTGGYKVSALEIEEVLRTHPAIKECAVVGVANAEWGEVVSAAVILQSGKELDIATIRTWVKERLAPYKAPSRLLVVEDLPRNVMGKITKPAIKKMFEGNSNE